MGDDVMGFEITDQDLNDEFNIDNRNRKRMSKNQQIYGMWADNSDEDDDPDARPTMGGRGKGARNYTAPVGFVSAGIQGAKKKATKDQDDDEDDQDGGDQGMSGPRGDSSDEDEGSFRGGLGAPRGRRAPSSYGKQPKFDPAQGQMAGMRTASYTPKQTIGKGFGEWEKHTKGIGAKLLLKMGFESGKGLGKNLQGRSTIVEAHLRKGKGAIGAYGKEGGRPEEKRVDSEEEEERDFKEKLHQWRKGGEKKKKIKYVYKSADQVLEDGKWRKIAKDTADKSAAGAGGKVKVIDMTGKQERVLSGYHAIASQKRPDDEITEEAAQESGANFAIPELTHNINLLLNNCEEDLISADRKLKYHKDRVEVLKTEESKLSELVEKEKEQITQIENVLEAVEKLEALHEQGALDLDSAQEMFHKMSKQYPEEYHLYGLAHIATTIVTPLLKKELSDWRVLEQPSRFRDLLLDWRDLVAHPPGTPHTDENPDPFYNLVWESWMPSVRQAISRWDTRQPVELIEFLKTWTEVVHPLILKNIRELIVLPKLSANVEQWNPMQDPVPIHSWLHPWLELLGAELDIVYPTIRFKLSQALTAWHPSDASARLILLPWRDVFDAASLQAFLAKNIQPKLETALASMVVDPRAQNMEQWGWFASWKDMLSPAVTVSLLQKHFFPKWLQVLASWLNHNPNYTEVTAWYQGWKGELGVLPEVLSHQGVRECLNQALGMMNRAVSGGTPMSMQPGAMESMRYLSSREAAGPLPPLRAAAPPPPPPPAMSESTRTSAQIPTGFKDLVAKRCADRGIVFIPIPGKFYEAKQVFRCGNTQIYLDRSVIFVSKNGMWVPTSLNSVIDGAI